MNRSTLPFTLSLLLGAAGCDSGANPGPAPSDSRKGDASRSAPSPGSAPAAATQPSTRGTKSPAGLEATAAGAAGSEGQTRTPSGLSFAIVKNGEGSPPPLGARVMLHITGRLPDGKVFVDTRQGNAPVEYKLTTMDLCTGLVEALQAMRTGERRKLHVPSKLGYKDKGFGDTVPPNADLDLDVELVSYRLAGP